MDSWVIFDADNTLWDIEHLYDDARNQLCQVLAKEGLDKLEVENYQKNRDVELYKTYGYSSCRFARSFEDTVLYFLGYKGSSDLIVHCRKIALEVFESEPRHNESVEEIFEKLSQKYKLGLITAGETWVQEKRLREFHLRHKIEAVEVVEKKTESVFRDFISKHLVNNHKSYMVGDSLKSDVLPALNCGLNAIWYLNHNWKENENNTSTDDFDNKNLIKIKELREVLNHC